MKAIVMNYKGSHKTQDPKRMILKISGVESKDAADKLKGKKAVWSSPSGKKLEGIITKAHGNKGAVLARFEKGLPGQALGTELEIQ